MRRGSSEILSIKKKIHRPQLLIKFEVSPTFLLKKIQSQGEENLKFSIVIVSVQLNENYKKIPNF
jgi:hypothetical protein